MLYPEGQPLVASWYDEGSRHAALIVSSSDKYRVEGMLFPAGSPRKRMTLSHLSGDTFTSHGKEYTLTEPNPQELETILRTAQRSEDDLAERKARPSARELREVRIAEALAEAESLVMVEDE